MQNFARYLAIGAALVVLPLTGATECAPQDGHDSKRQRDGQERPDFGRDKPVFGKKGKKSPKPKRSIVVCKKGDKRWVCPQDK
jgi:hypothetical protein